MYIRICTAEPDFIHRRSQIRKKKRVQKPRMIPLHRGQPLVFPDNGVLPAANQTPLCSHTARLRVIDRPFSTAHMAMAYWHGPQTCQPRSHAHADASCDQSIQLTVRIATSRPVPQILSHLFINPHQHTGQADQAHRPRSTSSLRPPWRPASLAPSPSL